MKLERETDVYFLWRNADREVSGRYGMQQGLAEFVAEVNEWFHDRNTCNSSQLLPK
jgi:hypothetical protein